MAVLAKKQPVEKMTVLSVRGSRAAHSREERETRQKLGERINLSLPLLKKNGWKR